MFVLQGISRVIFYTRECSLVLMWVTQGTQRGSGIVRCVIKLELF